jgi:hypothetical protein
MAIEAGGVAIVDWAWRDKAGGWSALKQAVTATLVKVGFEEKNIIFVTENRRPIIGEYMIDLWPPIKPSTLSVRRITAIEKNLVRMLPIVELAIIGEPV